MIGNPRCPICGLYELNDGSEETLWTCECEDDEDLLEITRIVNEPGMTWKVRQALLRNLGLGEEYINELVPPPPEGMDYWPSDY